MIKSVRQRWKNKSSKNSTFDAWLHLSSIENKIIFDIPIKYHKQFNKWSKKGKRLNSYIITNNYVQFVFEIETQPKKTTGKLIGIDTGIKALASTSDGKQFGKDIEKYLKKIKRCKQGSRNQKRKRNALKQYINEIVKEVINEDPRFNRSRKI